MVAVALLPGRAVASDSTLADPRAADRLPALVYRSALPPVKVLTAGVMQATTLPFIVAATAIGREIGVITAANQAALIAAGLVSVVIFPALGLALLQREPREGAAIQTTTKEAVT